MSELEREAEQLEGVRPRSYLSDWLEGVEHIEADSPMALDGSRAGFRLCFTKCWAGRRSPVHIFLTEEDAQRLARLLIAGAATNGKRWFRGHGAVKGPVQDTGDLPVQGTDKAPDKG